MEDQYRKNEQMELFEVFSPEEKRAHKRWIVVATVLTVVLLWSLWSYPAKAQPTFTLVKTGILCDEPFQLIETVDALAAQENHLPEGCGWLSRPVMAIIEPLASYENERIKVLTAKLIIGPIVQYSFIAWELKPPEQGV